MSTVYQAFNQLLAMFLGELRSGFPQHQQLLEQADDTLQAVIAANFKKPAQLFGQFAGPYTQKVMGRDESVIPEFDKSGLLGIKLADLWKDATDSDKDVIWQYLNSICFMGMGLNQLDDSGLAMVDSIVQSLEGSLP